MHLRKPWFLCKNTLAGVGLGLMAATAVFQARGEINMLAALQVGIVGFFLFIYAKGRGHHNYHHYGGYHKKHH